MYSILEYVFEKGNYFKATRFDGFEKNDSDWYIVKKDFYINGLNFDEKINVAEDIVNYLIDNKYIESIENYAEFNLYDEDLDKKIKNMKKSIDK